MTLSLKKFSLDCLTIAVSFLFLAEVQPVKFSSNSFLVLQFKESYRREQQREEREGKSARKRRAVSSSREEFSIRFRTRNANGLLLLASDSSTTIVSGYTVLEVGPITTSKQYLTIILEVLLHITFLPVFALRCYPIRTMSLRNHRYVFSCALQFVLLVTCFCTLSTGCMFSLCSVFLS